MAGQRLGHLDGIRGGAAFSVFVCHFIQTFLPHIYYTDRSESHGLWEDQFATSPFNIIVNGNFAVCLFFVLSGYVLSCRYLADGDLDLLRRLAIKRYLRLMLPTLGAVLVAWLILAAGGYSFGAAQVFTKSGMRDTYATVVPLWAALEQGTVGAFFLGQWSLDPVLWTMQTELFGSFLVFSLLALFAGVRWRWAAYGVAALIFYNGYYLAFVLGVALADLHGRGDGRDAPYPVILALVTCGIYFGSYPYYGAETGLWAGLPRLGSAPKPVFYHVLGAFLLILATCRFAEAREVFSLRPFRFLGRISYSLYLIHFPLVCSVATGLLLLLLPRLGYTAAIAVIFVIMVPVVVAAAALFTRLIDEPAIRLSERFARLMTGAAAPTRRSG
ncbi:MAG: acyltransferase [Rhodospirillaceae bacterium]